MNVRRILCPTDFSETSAHAVEQAAALAKYYRASILALHVFQPIDPSIDAGSLDGLVEQTAAVFEDVTKAGVKLEVAVDSGSPVRHSLDRAASLQADLIVMGTHGAGAFEHLVLGSVTEKVLRKAACPVREAGACLTLLHVLEWPWHEPPQLPIDELPPEQGFALAMFRRDAEAARARTQLESLVPPPRSGVRVDVVSGTPYQQVLATADRDKSDLIVLGVGRRSALNLTLLGSTANHVVRAAACPVLTLRDQRTHTGHHVH